MGKGDMLIWFVIAMNVLAWVIWGIGLWRLHKGTYLQQVISGSNQASSRRFIALNLLPTYILAAYVGIAIGAADRVEWLFYTGAAMASLPVLMGFFLFTWEHVISILNSNAIKSAKYGKEKPNDMDSDFDSGGYFDTDGGIMQGQGPSKPGGGEIQGEIGLPGGSLRTTPETY